METAGTLRGGEELRPDSATHSVPGRRLADRAEADLRGTRQGPPETDETPSKTANPRRTLAGYISSIGRHYRIVAIVMCLLIAATYITVTAALERHSIQQGISFQTSNQFIRFQQLANQTRALMRASADPKLNVYIIEPMVSDIRAAVEEIKDISGQIDDLYKRMDGNLLTRLGPEDGQERELRSRLNEVLDVFLVRAERVANATTKERQQRYSFWGAIDFAISSDSMLTGLFRDLIKTTSNRSHLSIDAAKLIVAILLAAIMFILVLTNLFLFDPLLRKLRGEHQRTEVYEDQLAKLAHTDTLTGLGNRSFFNLSVAEMLNGVKQDGAEFSVLLVDLDHFKCINDNYGHQAGDFVLRHVADGLKKGFRSGDLVVRLGGDEFAVLLPGLSDARALTVLAQRAADVVAEPVTFEARKLQLTVSIGGAIAPIHASGEAELIKVADRALYSAKKKRNSIVIFDDSSLAQHFEQEKLVAGLAVAAERDEFVVHYQPKINLRTGKHLGFEALVRWQHPELGLLAPGRFLPLMQDAQQYQEMTQAVVQAAARDLKGWKDAGLAPGSIAINLTETSLAGPTGYDILSAAIEENGLEWQDFVVEVTENVFLNRHAEQIHASAARFREAGALISLDDFGTGFASLVHLRDFPFDELKIDRSFVMNLGVDRQCEQIVRAVTDMSRNLGKHCVAEGIETGEQRQFLLNAGCDTGQGFLISKPQPAETMRAYLLRLSGTCARQGISRGTDALADSGLGPMPSIATTGRP